jgi:hypothetical protein
MAKARAKAKATTKAKAKAKPDDGAGYAGTPLPQKLGIKEGHLVGTIEAPRGFATTLGALPTGARVVENAAAKRDVVIAFVRRRAELEAGLPGWTRAIHPAGALWIAWPKKASGVVTDLVEDTIRDVALPTGLVDNKVCAIDATWSGLRLVVRLERR